MAVVSAITLPHWNGSLDSIPETLNNCQYWQYGNGDHSSEPRKILGSIALLCRTEDGVIIWIRHLALEGSSQWVVGQNIPSFGDICQMGQPRLVLQGANSENIVLLLMKIDRLLYLPAQCFVQSSNKTATTLSASSASTLRPSCEVKAIIDRAHHHVCGHSDYGDIKTLLDRNDLWNDDARDYVTQVISRCKRCSSTMLPHPARQVSLRLLIRSFNQVVCVYHMYLGLNCFLHIMDTKTHLSAGIIYKDTSLNYAGYALQVGWLTPFWTSDAIYGDSAFNHDPFISFAASIGSRFEAIPPRRHSKNALESKHTTLRSIYIRLNNADEKTDERTHIAMSFDISNQLYGSDLMSAYELAHGFSKPLLNQPTILPQNLYDAHDELEPKRKLTRTLRSKPPQTRAVGPGDMVEVFIELPNQKRGSWSSPRTVLDVDISSDTVSVSGSKGHSVKAALEDVRIAISDDNVAQILCEANDSLDRGLDIELSDITLDQPTTFNNMDGSEDVANNDNDPRDT